MSFDGYLQIKDAPGECTDDKHKDWIEIQSYSHHIHQPASATASSAGGATAERVEHGTFDFVHLLDKSSPKLFEFCCTGGRAATAAQENQVSHAVCGDEVAREEGTEHTGAAGDQYSLIIKHYLSPCTDFKYTKID